MQSAILALVIITAVGIFGYMVFERWSFTDALYMTVITLTTVGYKEVRALDASGQLWTMLLLITGVGTLFYAAVSSVELVVEGTVRGYFGRRRVKAAIGRLDGHYILCGYGRVGKQVAREFPADDVPFVVVEQDQDILEECLAEGNLALLGEASDDEVLQEAGILRRGDSSRPSTQMRTTSSWCSRPESSTLRCTSSPAPLRKSRRPSWR